MNRTLLTIMCAIAITPATTSAKSWVELTPVSGPMPDTRAYASAVLDTQNRRMIVFGGQDSGFQNDIWAFDLATSTWTDLSPDSGLVPAARRTPGSIYDPVAHRMITWAGQGSGVFFNDVWEFDLNTNTWNEFTPTGGPPNIRYGIAVAWDPQTTELVTFAGFTNMGRFKDVWRFHPTNDTWTDVSPVTGPIERCLHSASYDAVGHRLIMYGGQNAGALGDIWALDLTTNTWEDLTPATGPDARFFATHVYDMSSRRATVFGGSTNGGRSDEVWVFDLWTGLWTELFPSGTGPSARDGAAGVYDTGHDRIVFFGGDDGSKLNEVWAVTNLSLSPTNVPDGRVPAPVALRSRPNPFSSSTRVSFTTEHRGNVRVNVYDVRGRLVRSLSDGFHPAGEHVVQWDGLTNSGSPTPSGVYFVRVDAGGSRLTERLVRLQ